MSQSTHLPPPPWRYPRPGELHKMRTQEVARIQEDYPNHIHHPYRRFDDMLGYMPQPDDLPDTPLDDLQ